MAIDWSDVATAEATLLERCAAGDDTAYTELVQERQRMVGDPNESLDLSQEVFLRIFRTLRAFRGQAALRTWIYRIVINQALNRQRWWRRRHRSDQVSFEAHVRAAGEPAAEAEAAVPDHLPFDQRSAIVLWEIVWSEVRRDRLQPGRSRRYSEVSTCQGAANAAKRS